MFACAGSGNRQLRRYKGARQAMTWAPERSPPPYRVLAVRTHANLCMSRWPSDHVPKARSISPSAQSITHLHPSGLDPARPPVSTIWRRRCGLASAKQHSVLP